VNRVATSTELWPRLNLAEWNDTYGALHRRAQIIGKTRLRQAPFQNHWWHVVLYVTSRGLGTSPIPYRGGEYEIDLDFLDHQLVVRTSEGDRGSLPLLPEPIADFYRAYMTLLRSMGIDAHIYPVPSEMADTLRFDQDREHAAYDPDAAQRCWRALVQIDRVLKEFRGRFLGKSSPVHFWWGAFDIACTRFNGRRAPEHPGGIPNLPDWVTREAYSHECISAGWWPGNVGGPVEEAAFYAYAYPEPPGCPEAIVRPDGAHYSMPLREWVLPYEVVRTAPDPDAALMQFLTTTYEAAARLGGWDRAALDRTTEVKRES
jgi:Family of unknown function (DUF5996)